MRGHVARTDSQSGSGDDLNGDRNGGDEDNDAHGDDVAGGALFDSHLGDNACDEEQGGEGKSDGDEEDHALEMLTSITDGSFGNLFGSTTKESTSSGLRNKDVSLTTLGNGSLVDLVVFFLGGREGLA